ncbi:hypothetical protein AOD73_21315 [Pseudomonas aeruginosa]|nr:hypothetical protein PA1S_21325 [Pseudomonas aeruginosa PA1]ALE49941.1 hypothetical protein AOD73_21315 [Pseudomonas aeruginosa]
MDVDDWTSFTRHFIHLKDGAVNKDRTLLLSANISICRSAAYSAICGLEVSTLEAGGTLALYRRDSSIASEGDA